MSNECRVLWRINKTKLSLFIEFWLLDSSIVNSPGPRKLSDGDGFFTSMPLRQCSKTRHCFFLQSDANFAPVSPRQLTDRVFGQCQWQHWMWNWSQGKFFFSGSSAKPCHSSVLNKSLLAASLWKFVLFSSCFLFENLEKGTKNHGRIMSPWLDRICDTFLNTITSFSQARMHARTHRDRAAFYGSGKCMIYKLHLAADRYMDPSNVLGQIHR